MVAIFPNFMELTTTCLVRKIDINTVLFKGRENGTSEGLKRKEPGESGDWEKASAVRGGEAGAGAAGSAKVIQVGPCWLSDGLGILSQEQEGAIEGF